MRVGVAVLCLALAACSSEPTFDERYEAAEERITEKANELDAELENREAAAEENSEVAAEQPAET